ncbi:IclR family transcriptional regulator [Actinotalea subterranea]|uniref:IclR family transcriptional regulator n=1 Tax=Actinotalea subterranea TaxID=2607497 RepID=UPI0011F0125A|nr:IclR family transcriptional regulator [Actinotalea subterranea]
MAEHDAPRFATPAAARTLQVLELLADTGESLNLTEIAARLDLPKSSVHHMLAVLTEFGWVERDPETLRVTLGLRAWEVGQAYHVAQSMTQRARPFMDRVRDEIGETVRLAVRSGTDQVCIAKSAGPHQLVFDQRVGARLPCHATGLGKALLVGLTGPELEALYADGLEQYTETTLPDVASLRAELEVAAGSGYAEDHGEYILGIRCVAVPVRRPDGVIVSALSVSGPTRRFDDAHVAESLDSLQRAARELGRRLGEETDLT